MKTRVRKLGNSLALRIPKSLAVEARLSEDAVVELLLVKGKLVIRPVIPRVPSLDELLRGITRDNLHGEWNIGAAVRMEIW